MKMIALNLKFLSYAAILTAAIAGLFTACTSTPATSSNEQNHSSVTAPSSENHTNQGQMVMDTHSGHAMEMDLGPADAEYDLRFVDAMTPHHQGAVVMAEEVLQKSKRPELLKLAKAIIKAQTQEIKQMQQWRKAWYPKASAEPIAWHAAMGHSMAMSPEQMKAMMMSMDLGPADANFDLRFLNAMIPHHEGAIVMAEDALKKAKKPEIKQLSKAILTSQQAEIDQMKQWRKTWYNQ